jgi:VWFA-related protein
MPRSTKGSQTPTVLLILALALVVWQEGLAGAFRGGDAGSGAVPVQPAPAAAATGAPPSASGGGTAVSEGAVPEPFEESIEVTVVNLDVVVRDRSGRLATGLTRADFELFVDGRQVEITNFLSPEGRPQPAHPAMSEPANTPAGLAPEGQGQSLSLIVYVDNANMRPFDRNRLLKQVRSFLQKTLAPTDRVLVVTNDLGLHVRHQFREPLASLAPVLDQMEKETGAGIGRDIARRQSFEELHDLIQSLGCARAFDQAKSLAQADAESALSEERVAYAELHHLLRSLGGVEGRKALLYIGDGMATHAGADVFGLLQELCPAQGLHLHLEPVDSTSLMRQIIADANANLVTLHTLEATGLQTYASAEHPGQPLLSYELTQQIAADRQDSLTSLARETGGRSALNGADFSHDMEQIAAELSGAYSLGFTPVRAGEGKPHQVRVEVKRPGLHASYRSSYRDRTPQERLDGQVEAALLHGQTDNPLAASLKVGAGTTSEHGRILVPVQIRVPFAKLAFLPRDDAARHGRVNIVIGNMDARGGMAPLQRVQLPLRIPDADARRVLASNLGYDVKLLLEPGHQRLAFVVRDDLARIASCVVQELDVDKKGTVNLAALADR